MTTTINHPIQKKAQIGLVLLFVLQFLANVCLGQQWESVEVSGDSRSSYVFQNDTNRYSVDGRFYDGRDTLFQLYQVSWGESDEDVVFDTCKFVVSYRDGYKVKLNIFYPTGELLHESFFVNGLREDSRTEWFYNGSVRNTAHFSNGKYCSPDIRYFETGTLSELISFNADERAKHIIRFYKNGMVMEEYLPLDSLPKMEAVVWKWYYNNGQIGLHTIVNQGVQPYVAYFENGAIMEEGYINDFPGNAVGTWKYWDEKGNLTRTISYSSGSDASSPNE